jgi:CheY-like chemotaxis protein
VDDDLNAREAMGKLLHERGYIARGAFNGREALNLLRSGPLPDLILLDLWMEGGDGWEFRARQRRDAALAGIPVVVLSAVGDAAEWADDFGDVGYLCKPIDANDLFAAVEHFTFCPKPEVLVFEGEPKLRTTLDKALRHNGFRVTIANDAEEAAAFCKHDTGAPLLILVDAEWLQSLAHVRQTRPNAACCVMCEPAGAPDLSTIGDARVVAKPSGNPSEIIQVLWEIATSSLKQNRIGPGH